MKRNKTELGRSMVEMLGTLAIMGVLTIGGIAGYNYAITKHRANTLFTEAKMNAVQIAGLALTHGLPEEFSLNTDTYHLNYEKESDIGYVLYANDIATDVCRIVQRNRKVSWAELVLINEGQGCLDTDNLIEFYINTRMDTETTNPDRADLCESDADCGECGTCQPGGVCLFKNDSCPDPAKPYCNRGTCQGCEDGKYRNVNGTCVSCDTISKTTPFECHTCPNHFISTQGYCYDCENTVNVALAATDEECYSCPNRLNAGRYCYHCNSKFSHETADVALCSKCANRYVTYRGCFLCEGEVSADHKSCIFHCPSGYFGSHRGCQPCDSSEARVFMQPANDADGRAVCESCPNREYVSNGHSNPADGRYCAIKCDDPDKFLDANGNCRNCDSDSFALGWDNGPNVNTIYKPFLEKCLSCPNMIRDNSNSASCVNLNSTAQTWCFTPDRCKQYFKGKRYVAKATWVYQCTLCPEKDSEAWHNLTAEQQEQCTPG